MEAGLGNASRTRPAHASTTWSPPNEESPKPASPPRSGSRRTTSGRSPPDAGPAPPGCSSAQPPPPPGSPEDAPVAAAGGTLGQRHFQLLVDRCGLAAKSRRMPLRTARGLLFCLRLFALRAAAEGGRLAVGFAELLLHLLPLGLQAAVFLAEAVGFLPGVVGFPAADA